MSVSTTPHSLLSCRCPPDSPLSVRGSHGSTPCPHLEWEDEFFHDEGRAATSRHPINVSIISVSFTSVARIHTHRNYKIQSQSFTTHLESMITKYMTRYYRRNLEIEFILMVSGCWFHALADVRNSLCVWSYASWTPHCVLPEFGTRSY